MPTRSLFSARADFLVFWLPVLASVPLLTGAPELPRTLLFVILATVPLDTAHVVATYAAVRERFQRAKVKRATIAALISLVAVTSVVVHRLSPSAFLNLLGATTLFHAVRQQYGWMMLACNRAGQPRTQRFWDRLAIWTCMGFPIVWWLSSKSPVSKSYFHENDLGFLTRFIPAQWAEFGLHLHWSILLVCAVRAAYVSGSRINWAKLSLLSMTWIWFYGGLVLFASHAFFFRTLILCHGGSYIYFVFFQNGGGGGRRVSLARVLLATQGVALIWFTLLYAQLKGWPQAWYPFLFPLLWSPVLMHTVFDSFIWRRGMFESVKPARIIPSTVGQISRGMMNRSS